MTNKDYSNSIGDNSNSQQEKGEHGLETRLLFIDEETGIICLTRNDVIYLLKRRETPQGTASTRTQNR